MYKIEQNFYLNREMEYQEFDFSKKNLIFKKLIEKKKTFNLLFLIPIL